MAMCRHTRYKRMRQIAKRDGGWHCHYCGDPLMPIDDKERYRVDYLLGEVDSYKYELPSNLKWPTLDHKRPQIKGGKHEFHNLVLCCPDCNRKKRHSYSHNEFMIIAQGA